MKRRQPPQRTNRTGEDCDEGTLARIDDGELCAYQVEAGQLVERVTRPARRRSA